MKAEETDLPLEGLLVLDCSRMLPGAVLARLLLDLGARLIKVEDPQGGDPMRQVEPRIDGIGAAFAALYPGAESVALNLRKKTDQEKFRKIASRADILVETFRPGTMEKWELGAECLRKENERLIYCSMSSWGISPSLGSEVGHDLNFIAATGVLHLVRDEGIPSLQLADVGASLLAASAILAALYRRERRGQGATIDQPLVSGTVPLLAWAWADRAAGGGALETLLSGKWPCYRRYRCGDGLDIAVSTIEAKFWISFLEMLGLEHLAASGVDAGEEGRQASEAITSKLQAASRDEWVHRSRERGLPISPVLSLDEALADQRLEAAGLAGPIRTPGGHQLPALGPFIPSLGRTPDRPAPELNEHAHLAGEGEEIL